MRCIFARQLCGSTEVLESLLELKRELDAMLVVEGIGGWCGPLDIYDEAKDQVDAVIASSYEEIYRTKYVDYVSDKLPKEVLDKQIGCLDDATADLIASLPKSTVISSRAFVMGSNCHPDKVWAARRRDQVVFGLPAMVFTNEPTCLWGQGFGEYMELGAALLDIADYAGKFLWLPELVSPHTFEEKSGWIAVISDEHVEFRRHRFPTDEMEKYVRLVSQNWPLINLYFNRRRFT